MIDAHQQYLQNLKLMWAAQDRLREQREREARFNQMVESAIDRINSSRRVLVMEMLTSIHHI